MGNSEDRCGPEVSMWEPRKPQGRYNEVRETTEGRKRRLRAKASKHQHFRNIRRKKSP